MTTTANNAKTNDAKTNGAKNGIVHREIFIDAKPETVFAFLTDVEKMKIWMGVEHDIDPRPGGIYHVNVTGVNIARGTYEEVTPHSRIVFSWGWESEGSPVPPGSSRVQIDLKPKDNGTFLTLTHTGFSESAAASHNEGWTHYLSRLAIAATGKDPGFDPMRKSSCQN